MHMALHLTFFVVDYLVDLLEKSFERRGGGTGPLVEVRPTLSVSVLVPVLVAVAPPSLPVADLGRRRSPSEATVISWYAALGLQPQITNAQQMDHLLGPKEKSLGKGQGSLGPGFAPSPCCH
jgi:hypothetical protein